jgi:D-sedoheptulose 7-phosphate isomerase
MKHSFIQSQIKDSITVKERILNDAALIDTINSACQMIIEIYQAKGKTLIAGNGGSAADAQHLAAEFVNRFYYDRRGLPSMSLSTVRLSLHP